MDTKSNVKKLKFNFSLVDFPEDRDIFDVETQRAFDSTCESGTEFVEPSGLLWKQSL